MPSFLMQPWGKPHSCIKKMAEGKNKTGVRIELTVGQSTFEEQTNGELEDRVYLCHLSYTTVGSTLGRLGAGALKVFATMDPLVAFAGCDAIRVADTDSVVKGYCTGFRSKKERFFKPKAKRPKSLTHILT